ncbi:MAG TPA: oxidoreductase [Lachnospiraceae bacterium]|nr:oxidoreductase [Lachnospiraceae bacterium]
MKKISFGMVGGGNGAFIGDVHRRGAVMDNLAVLSAGCFSRDLQKNKETAFLWGVPEDRIYSGYEEMAAAEASKSDGIDFVSIVTPTDTHYAIAKCFLEHGIHVVCDKPVTTTLEECRKLQRLAGEKGLLFCVTYTYASYAVIQQAREMIRQGAIGNIINIIAEYPQDWLIVSRASGASAKYAWRLDPARSGGTACCSDIGTHLEALISKMTGIRLEAVLARFIHFQGSPLEHDIQVLLRYENNIPGLLWASQIAAGNDCGVRIRVFGEQGSLEWTHTRPMELRYAPLEGPVQILTANKPYCYSACTSLCRLPAGHPEGFYEAFGNIYQGFCRHLAALKKGKAAEHFTYPTIEDAAAGLRFTAACLRSEQNGNVWTALDE